ncbi:MAG: UvrD-helicase domain-containing protein, partial [Gammaproteobacteria bacterium]|nr:UvrD-helicase domain-containing protein [Gammaproteobacteria bacterium]
MNNAINIADQKERLRALDPATSFIVQAPAGSGKTGLLTQRYIMLLAGVDAPEEIVAITFTRKAAAEMRDRILQALEQANSNQPPDEAHEKHTWELARKAIARDREKGWQLLNNPGRLRIQTIDSLCTSLSRQMPVLSQFGSVPAITDDAEALYLEAARNTIADLESNEQWSDSISHLIQHLDSRLVTLQGLISTMLAKRDQWLRHVANPANPGLIRHHLEQAIVRIIEEALSDLSTHVPKACEAELLALARFAAGNIAEPDSLIVACRDLKNLPGFSLEDRWQWEGLAELLLTADGNWRKRLTKKEGFPAPSTTKDKEEKALYTEMKQRMSELLESLHDSDDFRAKLVQLRMLPSYQYKEEEWETLQALFKLLRLAAAHLEIVFSERGQVDFPALAQAAIRALGEPDAPTDLALALDYRIRHLLVDEFQDTAVNQYKLIEGLTAGWQPDDGHTLFVVGDPMQSIYRFREAEVSRFLDARLNGIGQVSLEFLRLSVNFRSQQGIVDWVNEKFPLILPQEDDIASAAVSYAASESFHTPLQGAAAIFYPSVEKDYAAEASKVVSIVKQAKAEHPEGKTAILVRGRTHLVDIVAQLQQANIGFQAVEIERLQHRQVVQDLSALTRALYYRHDRIAWLSILRAPYCGLTLNDLNILAGDDKYQTIITLLQQQERIDRLSEDGRCRLERVLPILEAALTAQSRCQLRTYVEGTWIALGGPACVTDETDLEDAEVYFQLLETLDDAGDAPDSYALNKKLEKLFALPDVE